MASEAQDQSEHYVIQSGRLLLEIPRYDPLAWLVQKWADEAQRKHLLQNEERLNGE